MMPRLGGLLRFRRIRTAEEKGGERPVSADEKQLHVVEDVKRHVSDEVAQYMYRVLPIVNEVLKSKGMKLVLTWDGENAELSIKELQTILMCPKCGRRFRPKSEKEGEHRCPYCGVPLQASQC